MEPNPLLIRLMDISPIKEGIFGINDSVKGKCCIDNKGSD